MGRKSTPRKTAPAGPRAPCLEDRVHFWALMVILALAVWLRASFLSVPVRYDEAWSYTFYSSRPAAYGISHYIDPNNHLLNTLLVHASCALLGNRTWAMRLPVFLIGILLVPATYLAVRFLVDRNAALLAAGLAAASSVLVRYSVNARGYIMTCFAFVVLLWVAGRIVEKRKPGPLWLAFALTASVGAYAVPTMLYPFVITAIWLFLSLRGTRRLPGLVLAVLLTGALTLLLYAPVLLTTGLASLTANDYVRPLPLGTFFHAFLRTLPAVWGDWNRDIPLALELGLAAGFFVAVVPGRHAGRIRVGHLAAGLLGALLVVGLQRSVPYARVWSFLLPLYLGMAAAGATWLAGRLGAGVRAWGWPAFSVLTAALTLFLCVRVLASGSPAQANDTTGSFEEAEPVARFLAGQVRPGDEIVCSLMPVYAPLAYYLNREGVETPVKACWTLGSSRPCRHPASGRRVFVVLKEGHRTGHTLPQQERFDGVFNEKQNDLGDILARHGMTGFACSPPRLVYQNGTGRVYEMDRGP